GAHTIGIALNKDDWDMEGIGPARLPVSSGGFFAARDTTLQAGRIEMGIQKVDILGPFDGQVPRQSDARRRLFVCYPSTRAEEELLTVATQGRLHEPAVLEAQVRRLLRDDRAAAFVTSFFGQWLSYRNVTAVRPDPKIFVGFDENLREAFQKETELFLASQVR